MCFIDIGSTTIILVQVSCVSFKDINPTRYFLKKKHILRFKLAFKNINIMNFQERIEKANSVFWGIYINFFEHKVTNKYML